MHVWSSLVVIYSVFTALFRFEVWGKDPKLNIFSCGASGWTPHCPILTTCGFLATCFLLSFSSHGGSWLLQKRAAQIKQYQCPQGPAMPPGNRGCWHREMWWGQMKPRAQGYLPKHRFWPLSLHRGDSKRGCQIEGELNSQADLQSCSLVGHFNQGAQWDKERLHERHRPTQRKGIVPFPEEDDLGRRQFIST